MKILWSLSTASLIFVSNVQATVVSTGFTVSLTGIDYFVPPKPVASINISVENKALFKDQLFAPLTVIQRQSNGILDLASVIKQYSEQDDVWQEGFLENIYYCGNSSLSNVSNTSQVDTVLGNLSPGPYFINTAGQVYEAWRLYSDVQGAFTESAIHNSDGSYSVLPAGTVGQKLAIAVPSRFYFEKTAKKPLAGVRIGIKDIFDIKGLRTSNSNRAWYWFYPPANNTAPPVQHLIDAGAIIVGKMTTGQFANGETATADWVDYHDAFNPRGDGYQDPSFSSAGGGAGAASYPWLDVTLGSDTGGSIRGPAHVQGIYGNRPSHGLVSLEHTTPLSPVFDTPGLLARDPVVWKEAAQALFGSNMTITDIYPIHIKTIGWPTASEGFANQLLINFLGNVSDLLNASTTAYNISAAWREDNSNLDTIETLLELTYAVLITKQQIELVRDPFYKAYGEKYDGRRPFVNPVPLARWDWGEYHPSTVEEAIANKTVFMDWVQSGLLVPSAQTCSENLVMYVGSAGSTTYRNTYLDEPRIPLGFTNSRISIMAETPDYVVPIGEVPYNSTISNHIEYLPVTVNFMAAKGCDGMLFSLIEALYNAGIVKESLPGRSSVTGGDILFKREFKKSDNYQF